MKTHSQENYHICPYHNCGKRYAHEYKLKNHISAHHEKIAVVDVVKYDTPPEKVSKTPKPSSIGAYGSASSKRPFTCPYEGCDKAYIHEYKLKLHLRKEHPEHKFDENAENAPNVDNEMDEGSDQDVYAGKRGNGKNQKSRAKPNQKMPPSKIAQRKGSTPSPVALNVPEEPWQPEEETYEEEDSEETEEDGNNAEDGWRYTENNDDDDEDTEYED